MKSADAIIHVHHPDLPPEWHCQYCNYGEYKNRDDWERRAVEHIAHCQSAPAPPAFLLGEFSAATKERCPLCSPIEDVRCIRREGHTGACKYPADSPACTCEVAYEFAPHPCPLHGHMKDEKPERKRFKTIGPPTEADLERIDREETRRFNSDELDKVLVAKNRCTKTQMWSGEMLGYPPLRCTLQSLHSGECDFND